MESNKLSYIDIFVDKNVEKNKKTLEKLLTRRGKSASTFTNLIKKGNQNLEPCF